MKVSGSRDDSSPWGRDGRAPSPAEALALSRRLVVKIGSASLVAESGEVRGPWLDALADDVARCQSRAQEVILYDFLARLYESRAARAARGR